MVCQHNKDMTPCGDMRRTINFATCFNPLFKIVLHKSLPPACMFQVCCQLKCHKVYLKWRHVLVIVHGQLKLKCTGCEDYCCLFMNMECVIHNKKVKCKTEVSNHK